jgi:TPR repeat protein
MYETGQGVAQDYKQALYWYTKAAEQGDSMAQYSLGRIYEAGGQGVAIDYVAAYKWWSIAAFNGEDRAGRSIRLVEGLMTPEQIAEAKRRASAWIQAHAKK